MLTKLLFILACLILPVVWGWLVHALFRMVETRGDGDDQDRDIFPDYQI